MKKVLIGGFLSLIGSIWALAVAFFAGINHDTGWSTPPGRFLTAVIEVDMLFVFVLSVVLVITGISIMLAEFFRKEN